MDRRKSAGTAEPAGTAEAAKATDAPGAPGRTRAADAAERGEPPQRSAARIASARCGRIGGIDARRYGGSWYFDFADQGVAGLRIRLRLGCGELRGRRRRWGRLCPSDMREATKKTEAKYTP
ncbi:hypothetical protein [Frigoriglobus tundricola]|uniref:Uncharacterized protein n=1 Tax=Frigoriglobus tundricola TaxID=2774151 RepID=A0A6M5Z332_9BACT|nr:hypothetical protein [Frigoriglobus tundricola]QJX00830.1 hypothetical protein FTUN_8468 [Frigoriglobus tundricola]